MNLETKRLLYFYLEVFLMIIVIGLLILNFYQMRKKEFQCVRDPKSYLVKHFERSSGGNISCQCVTDNPKAFQIGSGTGYRILFGSEHYPNSYGDNPFS